jgi:hypothetical protein
VSEYVTREEFSRFADRITGRIDQMDSTGTRGVAVLAVQMQELAKDMAAHEVKHDREMSDRRSTHKWWVMAAIAAIAAIDGPIVTVVLSAHH